MKIGLISDTHNFLDPQIPKLFAGVEHILHAGDVGLMSIINALENIAPVTAVYGNTDAGLPIKETEIIELDGTRILLHHIVDPFAPETSLRARIHKEQPRLVVFGHTHKPFQQVIEGVTYLNPGYAGKQRFELPRSAAILDLGKRPFHVHTHWL